VLLFPGEECSGWFQSANTKPPWGAPLSEFTWLGEGRFVSLSWLCGGAPTRVGEEEPEGPMPQERTKPEVTRRQGQGRHQLCLSGTLWPCQWGTLGKG